MGALLPVLSWQDAHTQLQRICFCFSQHLSFKSISGATKQNKNLRVFQKWKPSLIKVKEVGGYNSFVKSLQVRRVPVAGKVGNAGWLLPLGKAMASSFGLCLGTSSSLSEEALSHHLLVAVTWLPLYWVLATSLLEVENP